MKALRVAGFLLLVSLIVNLSPSALAKSVDATEEGWQIRERIKWFYGMRGLLNSDPLPGAENAWKLRANAARDAIGAVQALRDSNDLASMWTFIGPAPIGPSFDADSGRVTAVQIHPTNDQIIYVGAAAGGVWKTTDGGVNWRPIFDSVGTQPVGAVALAPWDPNEIWVGTGDFVDDQTYKYIGMGVWRSTDAGATWQDRTGTGANIVELDQISSIALHPTDPNTIVVGGNGILVGNITGEGAIYRTTDGGANWTLVYDRSTHEIVRDSSNPNVLYAARRASIGVVKSTDGGATWADANNGLVVNGDRVEIAISPSNPQVLYAISANADLYRTTDGAANWTLRYANACDGQCWYNLTMKVASNDPNTLYFGGLVPWKTTDGGATISRLSLYGAKLHPDVQHIERHPTDPNTIYVGTDGGLWVTTDGGVTFDNLNGNLGITQFYDIAIHPTDDTIALGGSQDNSCERYEGNINWKFSAPVGDGMVCAIHPNATNVWFAGTYPGATPAVFRTVNAPTGPWTKITNGINETSAWVTPYILDPNTPNTMYLGARNLWRSTDRGNNWTKLTTITGSFGSSIAVAPSDSNVIYYGVNTGNALYRSTDGGATFADVGGNLPGGATMDIAVHPTDPMHVYVTKPNYTTSALWYSTTGGTTWTGVQNGLPKIPSASVLVLDNPHRVYVGNDVGVYVAGDDDGPYIPDMNGMPVGMVISDLEYNSNTNTITAATYGRGAWQKDATAVESWNVTVGKGAASGAAYDSAVKAYRVDGSEITQISFTPYSGTGFGVNTAGADVTGDSVGEILTGQGPGPTHAPNGKGYTNVGTAVAGLDFAAYAGSGYGLNIAGAELDADGFDEILTGPGEGAVYGPQARGFNYDNSGSVAAMGKLNFYAYGTLKFGVNVAGATTDTDANYDEILTGAGPGAVFGPHVRGWNFDGGSLSSIAKINFFAYGTLKFGVNVNGGELDRDGFQEIITGAGPGVVFAAQVRAFNVDGGSVSSISKINYWAYGSGSYGVNVTSDDLDGDGFAELATGQGPDAAVAAVLKGWDYDASAISQISAMNQTAFSGVTYGLTVGSGAFGY